MPRKFLLKTSASFLCMSGLVAISTATAQSANANPEAQAAPGLLAEAKANPCNPCAGANPCNPCAGANPCNPCAGANPCNPCAGANPCNPCAGANPCKPCAGANPCNPCAAGGGKAVDDKTAADAYEGMKDALAKGYAKSGIAAASDYQGWTRYSTGPYVSVTHGERFVNNYANNSAYGGFEDAGDMPAGTIVAKDSIIFGSNGKAKPGPLFLMEKMAAGFDPENGDWKYTMVMPDGSLYGETKGKNSSGMTFCSDCHMGAVDNDYLFFLPDDYRRH